MGTGLRRRCCVSVSSRFSDAVDMARRAHDGVVRKGTDIPYLAHVLSVAALVFEFGGDEDQAIAGLLHDVAEDAGGEAALAEIAARFGTRVADIVRACSDAVPDDPQNKPPWGERKVAYIRSISSKSDDAVLVTACDKLHNARAIVSDQRRLGDALFERFNSEAGRSGVLWYYTSLVDALVGRLEPLGPDARELGAELQRTVHELTSDIEARDTDVQASIEEFGQRLAVRYG